jgi:hypothetical protein
MRLLKYYRYAALLPLAITSITGIASGIVHDVSGFGKDYYRNPFSNGDGFWETMIFGIIFSAFICAVSASLLLNGHQDVRKRNLISFLAWFLLPGTCIGYTWWSFVKDNTHRASEFKLNPDVVFITVLMLPHTLALILTFIKFRRDYAKAVYENV